MLRYAYAAIVFALLASYGAVAATYTVGAGDTLGFAFVSASTPCVSGTPPSDATSLIQGCLDAGGDVVLPAGVWNVSGLTFPTGGGRLRGVDGTTLHVTASAAAIACSSVSARIEVRDLIITGTGPNYDGTWTSISDAGQKAIRLYNCPYVLVQNVRADHIAGAAFDCEFPAFSYNGDSAILFDGVSASHTWRAFWAHNYCEYAVFSNLHASNNVWASFIESGNVTVSNFVFRYNYSNIRVDGSANQNPCHGTFANGSANHGNYNLDVQSCAVGMVFSDVNFIAGAMNITNSTGVTISGGQYGSALSVNGTGGANMMMGSYVRDSVSGYAAPSFYSGGLLLKNNYNAFGLMSWNN